MSVVDHILLASLLLAVPLSMKYVFAFEVRKMVAILKAKERQVARLTSRFTALERERGVVEGALLQVEDQRRWASTRRSLIEEELVRVQRHGAVDEDALPAAAEAYA